MIWLGERKCIRKLELSKQEDDVQVDVPPSSTPIKARPKCQASQNSKSQALTKIVTKLLKVKTYYRSILIYNPVRRFFLTLSYSGTTIMFTRNNLSTLVRSAPLHFLRIQETNILHSLVWRGSVWKASRCARIN